MTWMSYQLPSRTRGLRVLENLLRHDYNLRHIRASGWHRYMLDVVIRKREALHVNTFDLALPLPLMLSAMSVAGLGLWFLSVWNRPLHLNGYGLLPSLNVLYWIGTVLCLSSFGIALTRASRSRWLLMVTLASLLATLDLTPIMLEHTARFTYVYVSYGYADYIVRHHALNLHLFIYQNWPLVHILIALLVIAGIKPMAILMFGPVIATAAFAWLVKRIAWLLTWDEKVSWAASGLYVVTSAGTNYVLPATGGLLLALTTVMLVLGHWRRKSLGGAHLRWLWCGAAVACILIVPTHLLSTLYLSLVLLGFLVLGRIHVLPGVRPPYLLVVLALIGWQFSIASSWTMSTLPSVMHAAFHLDQVSNASQQLAFGGSLAHSRVASLRLFMYLLISSTAGCAWLLEVRRNKRLTPAAGVLALGAGSPFLLVLVTSYSGEIVSRAFGLAMPFLVIAAALLIGQRKTQPILVLTAVLFTLGYPVYAYGNDLQDYVSPTEVAASQYLINHMPPAIKLTNTLQRTITMGKIDQFYSYPAHPVAVTFMGKPFDRQRQFSGVSARQAGMIPTCHKPWYTNSEVRIYVCTIRGRSGNGRRGDSGVALPRYR